MRVVITRREALNSPDGVNIFIVALAQALVDLVMRSNLLWGALEVSLNTVAFWLPASICRLSP